MHKQVMQIMSDLAKSQILLSLFSLPTLVSEHEINRSRRKKVECSYTYWEPIDEKFAPANSNREEAWEATNSVIQRLVRIGKLEEFDLQMREMEKMGTIERLSDEEVKELQHKVHHFNKLNFTTSSTSSSTPLRVLRDSTSKVPNTGGIFSVISQVAGGIDIGVLNLEKFTKIIQKNFRYLYTHNPNSR